MLSVVRHILAPTDSNPETEIRFKIYSYALTSPVAIGPEYWQTRHGIAYPQPPTGKKFLEDGLSNDQRQLDPGCNRSHRFPPRTRIWHRYITDATPEGVEEVEAQEQPRQYYWYQPIQPKPKAIISRDGAPDRIRHTETILLVKLDIKMIIIFGSKISKEAREVLYSTNTFIFAPSYTCRVLTTENGIKLVPGHKKPKKHHLNKLRDIGLMQRMFDNDPNTQHNSLCSSRMIHCAASCER
jgi:hypothetical protein